MTPSSQRAGGGSPAGRTTARSIIAMLPGVGALRRRADLANVAQLQMKLGCSLDEARRVYALARELGFGAAYETVFGKAGPISRSRHLPRALGVRTRPMRHLNSQHGRRPQTP